MFPHRLTVHVLTLLAIGLTLALAGRAEGQPAQQPYVRALSNGDTIRQLGDTVWSISRSGAVTHTTWRTGDSVWVKGSRGTTLWIRRADSAWRVVASDSGAGRAVGGALAMRWESMLTIFHLVDELRRRDARMAEARRAGIIPPD
jgi:hypothetical protein